MLLLEKGARTFLADRQLGSSLAVVAGAVNASAFLSVGYYCANMTGNVSAFATNFVNGKGKAALIAGGLALSFLSGAMLCTVMMNAGRRRGENAIYAYSVLLEAVLLAGLSIVQIVWLHPSEQSIIAPAVLSFLMGMQNATVTRISGAVVRTTHVTGMITDLGIELADWLGTFRNKMEAEKHTKMRQRLWLHSQIIGCFVLGSAIGAYGYNRWPASFLLIIALFLGALAVQAIIANALGAAGTAAQQRSD
ncbi:YoaK family protein [Acetobacter indonesiensis]|uniref:YoaK family protein n=1 Tax=Acetobacter indonesiensis TaxID=104101 RepID=UPI0020A5C7C2|nr:YoaK family protein [Acetobacter indonesiensis]MCP1231458.1 DUF1275 domain-containing protein [Acetobacter indonesiensis]